MRLDANKRIIGIKAESTRGTYAAPQATDVYAVWDLNLVDRDAQVKEFSVLQNSLTRNPSGMVMGAIYGTANFKIYAIVGSDSAQAAHITALTRIWNACGLQTTTVSTASVVKPHDAANTSVSVVVNVDGRDMTLRGASGNCKLVMTAGEVPYWDVTLTGVYTGTTETASLGHANAYNPTPAIYNDTSAITLNDGAGAAVDMYACWRSIELDPGYSVAPLANLNGTQGVQYFSRVGNPTPKLSFQCYKFRTSNDATQYDAEADAAFRLGQTVTLTIADTVLAYGKLSQLQPTEDNGWVVWDGVIDLRSATAEAEWLVTVENAA
jgi:hypothetical protein